MEFPVDLADFPFRRLQHWTDLHRGASASVSTFLVREALWQEQFFREGAGSCAILEATLVDSPRRSTPSGPAYVFHIYHQCTVSQIHD